MNNAILRLGKIRRQADTCIAPTMHVLPRSGATRLHHTFTTAPGFRSNDKQPVCHDESSCEGAVHSPPSPTCLVCPSINRIAAKLVQRNVAYVPKLEVSILVFIG